MAFEEQIQQYKQSSLSARLVLMCVIGAMFPLYVYNNEYESVEAEVSTAEQDLQASERKLQEARKKQEELPERLRELENLRAELDQVRAKVSANSDIDEVLRRTAIAAKDTGISMADFKPEDPLIEGQKIRYTKQNIRVEAEGRFAAVTRFLDALLNIGSLTFISDISYSSVLKSEEGESASKDVRASELTARTLVQVRASMLVYRKAEIN